MKALLMVALLALASCERDSMYACGEACRGRMLSYSQAKGCTCVVYVELPDGGVK
jgi:hypothetical protein